MVIKFIENFIMRLGYLMSIFSILFWYAQNCLLLGCLSKKNLCYKVSYIKYTHKLLTIHSIFRNGWYPVNNVEINVGDSMLHHIVHLFRRPNTNGFKWSITYVQHSTITRLHKFIFPGKHCRQLCHGIIRTVG